MSTLEYHKVQKVSICKQTYTEVVKNSCKSLDEVKNSKWNTLREALVTTVKMVILREEKSSG